MDALFCSKYPFSQYAKEYMETHRLQLSYAVIEKAKRRVKSAIVDGEIPKPFGSMDAEVELASYPVSRMLISGIGGKYYIKRYAIAEAKRAYSYMREEEDGVLSLIAKDFGIEWDGRCIPLFTYLRFLPPAIEYKLVFSDLKNGKVYLEKMRFCRVLSEAAGLRIEAGLPLPLERFPEEVKEAVAELRAELPKPEANAKFSGEFPPCIQKLLDSLRESENLPHTARWVLAVFLLNAGMSTEQIIKTFSTSPDFSERTTRYQVEYAEKRKYQMPSCAAMDSYGICVAKCGIKNPLNYGAKR